MLDLLDALVRKSLLVVDRLSGRTRYSMLETIREFAEEQLVARGDGDGGSGRPWPPLHPAAHRGHDRVGQPRPTGRLWAGSTPNFSNLRTAFRWAADENALDDAVTIATHSAFLGYLVKKSSR